MLNCAFRIVICLALLGVPVTAFAQNETHTLLDIEAIRVVSTTEIDLPLTSLDTAAYLAPNGRYFAYVSGNNLCLYEGVTEQKCVSLGENGNQFDRTSFHWSPDSRYLAFTENFYILFVDADIWVWDTMTDSILNLTDDGDNSIAVSNQEWKNIDVLPTWLDDGRIAFLRFGRETREDLLPLEVHAVSPETSETELLGTLEALKTFWIYALDANASHLWYNYNFHETPERGIWFSDLNTENLQQVLGTDEDFLISGITVAPNGDYALLNTPSSLEIFLPSASKMQLLDLTSGEVLLVNPEHHVITAAWSPDGTMLSYIVNDNGNDEENGLYITENFGEPGQQVLAGNFLPTVQGQRQSIRWAANNTILLSRSPEQDILMVELGS